MKQFRVSWVDYWAAKDGVEVGDIVTFIQTCNDSIVSIFMNERLQKIVYLYNDQVEDIEKEEEK